MAHHHRHQERRRRSRQYVAIFSDITEQKAAQERTRYLAEHDILTGLPNRMLLLDRLRQAIARGRRSGDSHALMFADLDRFKEINDAHGHRVGDQLLLSAAQRLAECVRGGDTISRQGGDEFVVMVTDIADPSDAEKVAQKLLQSVAQPFVIDGQEPRV